MATATRIELRLKMDLPDHRQKMKAFKALSTFSGIDSITIDSRAHTVTVIGCVDPVDVVCRLRKLWFAVHILDLLSRPGGVRKEKKDYYTPVEFTLEFLNRITNNFSEERIIDRGRYGAIYKGVRDNGECVAVKKLNLKPGLEGEEFINEFNKLKRIQHRNITRLVGHCHHIEQMPVEHNGEYVSATVEERALCFEYLEGSLDKHLSNEPCGAPWYICYRIIRGICEGLDYLHKGLEHPIYHLDLKPTNIFLDRDMNPQIGGFGLSLFDSLETNNISEDMETSVYMPPEFINEQQIAPKFDIFSLGVIIIQIMAGTESYSKCADTPPEEFVQLLYRTREFTLEFLERITNKFSEQNIVGRGAYGVIYKGVLDNGEEIAVKKLHQMLWIDNEQFKNELNNLMRVKHKNIVRLVGYCHNIAHILVEYKGELVSAMVEQRALCLEYLQGGSLDNHISDDACRLDWDTCYKIIKGICEGLDYLHNGSDGRIYHLDLKPSNILLDKDMVPKIGDFGLSRLFDSIQTYMTQSQDVTGTRGYMPPEYINKQTISQKFDVFSLGVIIIQMMAGKEGYFDCVDTPPEEFIKLVHGNWRKRLLQSSTVSYHASREVRTCIELALRCVETDRAQRPTITQIVNELNNIGTAKSSPVDQRPTIVTRDVERPYVPHSRNVVLGAGMRKHFRLRRVKIHLKRRTTFRVPVPRSRRLWNLVTMWPTNKLTAWRTSILFTHFKYWLPLLIALVVAIFLAWPQLCPESWSR